MSNEHKRSGGMHGKLITVTYVARKDEDLPLLSMAGYAISSAEASAKLETALKELELSLQNVRRVTTSRQNKATNESVKLSST